MEGKWYDVHFRLNGFYKIKADTVVEAIEKAEEILKENLGSVESIVNTGLDVEVVEAIAEE